ncbi:MAG: hypothetical protein OXD46_12995 [Chloroflexi bacterium]|nr:hypothetical protein [Chloroflexota bacterium]
MLIHRHILRLSIIAIGMAAWPFIGLWACTSIKAQRRMRDVRNKRDETT